MPRAVAPKQCAVTIRCVPEIELKIPQQNRKQRRAIALVGTQVVARQVGDLRVVQRDEVDALGLPKGRQRSQVQHTRQRIVTEVVIDTLRQQTTVLRDLYRLRRDRRIVRIIHRQPIDPGPFKGRIRTRSITEQNREAFKEGIFLPNHGGVGIAVVAFQIVV